MELNINCNQEKYKIILENGIINKIGEYINLNRKVALISDEGVPEQYIAAIKSQCNNCLTIILKQGEISKSFETFEFCLKELISNNFTRNNLIIALGGGVVGDLAGFVASSYMRGIDFINVPTTTLSQIDSSIGGKVGINVNKIKNCVGAFYQPKCVFIDFDVLKTLNKRLFNEGLVEAIKAGLIMDKELFEMFENEQLDIEKIIYKSLVVKKYFVEKDEKEMHERKILNFGHTIGHAYESYYGLKKFHHGECVAMGMMKIIDNEKIKNRLENILKKLDIPTSNTANKEEIFEYIKNDKKAFSDKISIIKLKEIGCAFIEEIELERLRDIL